MDKLILNGTDGFPLYTDTLAEAQGAWNVFNAFCGMAGDKVIISGCVQAGTNVSDGFIVIDGEVLPFKGGAVSNSIIIKEEITEREFKNKSRKPVFMKRMAIFGSSTPDKTYQWADFKPIKNLISLAQEKAEKTALKTAEDKIVELEKQKPIVGEIKQGIFDLDNLPEGWFHCNGENGTPDLRGYFLRGKTDERALGSFQEDAQQKITGRFSSFNRDWRGGNPNGAFALEGLFNAELKSGGHDNWGHNYNFDSSRQVRTADENRPKNYAVHFIMYLGKK